MKDENKSREQLLAELILARQNQISDIPNSPVQNIERLMLNSVSQAIIATDVEGKVLFWNGAAEQLYGWTAAAATGRSVFDMVVPDISRQQGLEIMEKLSRGETWQGRYTCKNIKGEVIEIDIIDRPIFDEQGALVGIIGISQEAGKIKSTEVLYSESEQRFRAIAALANDLIFEWSLESEAVEWYGDIDGLLGYEPGEFPRNVQAMLSQIHPDDRDLVFSEINHALDSGERFTSEYRIRKKDGNHLDILSTGRAIYNDRNQFVKWIGTNIDISRRKEAEKALQISEETQRMIMAGFPDLAFILSEEGIHLDYHAADPDLLFTKPDQFLGKSVGDILPAEVAEKFYTHIELAIKHGKAPPFEYQLSLPKGETDHFEARLIKGGNDRVISLIRDITEQKRAAERAITSESRVAEVMDSIEAVVYVADMETYEVLFLNKYARNIWGDVEGEKCWQAIQKDLDGPCSFCTNNKLVNSAGNPNEVYIWELRNTRNGRWYECRDQAIKWDDGRLVRLEIATDITERKQAAAELDRQRYFLEKAQEIGSLGTWDLDVGNNILTWTDENYRIFGIPIGTELTYEIFLSCIHPDDREYVDREWKAAFSGKPYDIEHRLIADGKVKWVREKAELEFDDAGECIRGIGVTQDITEKKLIEEQLREERNRIKLYLDTVEAIIVSLNSEGIITSINRKGCELFGKSEKELIGINWYRECLPQPEGMEKVFPVHQQILSGDMEGVSYFENEIVTGSGELRLIGWHNNYLSNDNGNIVGTLSAGEDITERRKAENNLRESEQLLNESQAVSNIGGYRYDIIAGVWTSTKQMDIIFGIDENYAKSVESWVSIIHPEDQEGVVDYLTNEVLGQKKEFDRQYRIKRVSDGEVRWVHGRGVLELDANGAPITLLGTINDITEDRQREAEHEELEAKLQQSQKMEAIGTLAGGIAHDFNNLLTGILGYSNLLRMKLPANSPEAIAAQTIESAAERASELTAQLLGFARRGKHRIMPVDIHQLINEVTGLLGRSIDKKIAVKRSLGAGIPLVKGDPGQLQQVLMNLGINSRDAMDEGGELIFKTEEINLDDDFCSAHIGCLPGDHLLISVIDTGRGIPPEHLGQIFEPFFTTKPEGKGTGMGLAMVYGIINNHDGFIDVISAPGEGTTINIYLPRLKDSSISSSSKQGDKSVTGTGNILFIDDEEVVRDVARHLLEQLGYKVIAPDSAREALEYFRENSGDVDLVIVDMIMPELNGEDCFKRLKEVDPGVRVILSTGFELGGRAEKIMADGAKGFIHKPYRGDQLSRVVAEALAEK